MATKKPVRKTASAKDKSISQSLMDNQDTANKGDSVSTKKVCMTFWVSPARREKIKRYAQDHEMTVSRLIVEGLEQRMSI